MTTEISKDGLYLGLDSVIFSILISLQKCNANKASSLMAHPGYNYVNIDQFSDVKRGSKTRDHISQEAKEKCQEGQKEKFPLQLSRGTC